MKRFHVKTYGCQMNERDSESVRCLLEARGWVWEATEALADVVILNTCSVRDQAERKALGKMGILRRLKRTHPEVILGIMGCMAQRLGDGLKEQFPHLDFVIGTDQIGSLPEILEGILAKRGYSSRLGQDTDVSGAWQWQHRGGGLFAQVAVMRGCDQFCTYCVVPYTRGREKSRSVESIRSEVAELGAAGVKEILLLGQNITAYGVSEARQEGRYTPEFSAFADLLMVLNEVPGLERIRFTSPHVRYMNEKFIEAICTLPKVCKSFHIPVQSGSDRILRLMNRQYTVAEYMQVIEAIRVRCPQAALTTDVIVGFSGETAEDFQQTRDLMRAVEYDMAYIFRYSTRTGTRAEGVYPDDVPEELKHERNQLLLNDLAELVERRNQAYLGRMVEVLVEGVSKRNESRWTGRTDLNKVCLFTPRATTRVGDLLSVKVTRTTANSLFGEIVE